jgi:hypothetical protein
MVKKHAGLGVYPIFKINVVCVDIKNYPIPAGLN